MSFYNPYISPAVPFQSGVLHQPQIGQMQTIPQVNTLPQQQVLQANGKASIDALRMAPNSSALIMDTTAPIVWLCTTDSLGNVTAIPYDTAPHKDAPAVDVESVEERLSKAEASITQIMEVLNNAKSNVGRSKSKQNDGDARETGSN